MRRSPFIEKAETSGLSVQASEPQLLATLGGRMLAGRFLDAANEHFPLVVLGDVAARRLGVRRLEVDGRPVQVYIGETWFTVAGIMGPVPLAPEIERAALIGYPIAHRLFRTSRHASIVYVRADPEKVREADALLGATAYPASPEDTQVSRPSEALQARADAQSTLTAVFLGLGAVALLVGGVGIANVMVISVLERRPGDRAAQGARRPRGTRGRSVLGGVRAPVVVGRVCRNSARGCGHGGIRLFAGLGDCRSRGLGGGRGGSGARTRSARGALPRGAGRPARTRGRVAQRLSRSAPARRAIACGGRSSAFRPTSVQRGRSGQCGVRMQWSLT